jgi:GST-like protein
MPKSDTAKFETLQWLMFQMGGVGPMLGQAHHFRIYAPEKIDYAYDRYTNEAKRIYGVLDKQVQSRKFIAGNQYSIADIATFPWIRSWKNQGIDWSDYPALKDWFDRISERPAVKRGVDVLANLRVPLTDDTAKQALFGATQYAKR